ncbi:MAG: V-type ATP synthase subunit A [Promethearchaeota archaeon]
MNELNQGYISAIIGSLIKVKGLENSVRLNDMVKISKHNILAEIIQIFPNHVVAQCFENTLKVKLFEKVENLNQPLSMELGPGLISSVFDGIQRPLEIIFQNLDSGILERGIKHPALSRKKKWHFIPLRKIGDKVKEGDIIGSVKETKMIEHKIMLPPSCFGKISFITDEGDYNIIEEIYKIKSNNNDISFPMLQTWPITKKRPYKRKEDPNELLITGMRVIDLLFPIVKGGTVAIPGGFGTGKTVIQQSLAKWCNADVVVFIGCGEPGNEIASVLKQFSEIKDSKNDSSLLNHIILIANTSNMPVSAREASLFSGVTIAEYYRDMGYDVVVLADSISRWAESLREISGLLEEMPAEEGYPAYLPSKLSSFYERAGVVQCLGMDNINANRKGSLTIVGTISPPAGDFSEPVTSTIKRLVQVFLALDPKLAYLKHYPAINWLNSYSNYPPYIANWWYERDIDWPEINIDWFECRKQVNEILSQEKDLEYIIQLIGEKNLPEVKRLTLFVSKMIKNGFLIQSAFDEIDCFTDTKKLLGLIKLILLVYNNGKDFANLGLLLENMFDLEFINKIMRISQTIPNDDFKQIERIKNEIIKKFRFLTI